MKISFGQVMAISQIITCVLSAGAYAFQRDWRHTLYWFFAACLSAVVTF